MAEACGSCDRSFLPNRKTNESLKCACQRPFFSQTVARNNLPTDRDCWIEVPKRFVRHYSSLFGESVKMVGGDGRPHHCTLVGSDIAIVGYGFEWYDFASSHNVGMGDQIVFTLMEKSRFLVQVHRQSSLPSLVAVKVEQDGEIQVAGAQDWLLAKARRNIPHSNLNGADVDRAPLEATRASDQVTGEGDGMMPNSEVVSLRRNGAVGREGSNSGVAHKPETTVNLSSAPNPLANPQLMHNLCASPKPKQRMQEQRMQKVGMQEVRTSQKVRIQKRVRMSRHLRLHLPQIAIGYCESPRRRCLGVERLVETMVKPQGL